MARQYAVALISRTFIRVAAPSARQALNGALRSATVSTAISPTVSASVAGFTRGFSASGLRADATEKALAELMTAELKTEQSNYETPEEIKDGPPAPFQLVETEGTSEVVLTREFDKEQISISFVVDDEEQHLMDSSFDEEGDEEEEDFQADTVFFTVDISKDGADTLTFDCVTNGTDIDIKAVLLEGAELEDTSAYTGPPDYSVLDDALHESFQRYLEARGVNEALAAYIVDFTQDKEQREYMGWLGKIDKFLKA